MQTNRWKTGGVDRPITKTIDPRVTSSTARSVERERSNDRASAAAVRTVAVYYAIFLSPTTYSHLRSRLHHRGSKVLLLVHRCALVFLFILAARSSVSRFVGWMLGRMLGRSVVAWVSSFVSFFVRGLRAPNESWPVIIRSCCLPDS